MNAPRIPSTVVLCVLALALPNWALAEGGVVVCSSEGLSVPGAVREAGSVEEALGSNDPSTLVALLDGRVVRLAAAQDDGSFHTRVAVLAVTDAGEAVDAFRDYSRLPEAFPEFRGLAFEHGLALDRFALGFKVHPLFPAIRLGKRVTWTFDDRGNAQVDIELESSSTPRVTGQTWTLTITNLGGGRCLLVYDTLDRYVNPPSPDRLLDRLAGIAERLVGDVRTRCELGARAGS